MSGATKQLHVAVDAVFVLGVVKMCSIQGKQATMHTDLDASLQESLKGQPNSHVQSERQTKQCMSLLIPDNDIVGMSQDHTIAK